MVAIEGPRFSSKAESRMFRQWGGEVINMTALPEVVLAKEAKICYASIAMATDYDCWRETEEGRVCVADVLETFKKNVDKVTKLVSASVLKVAAKEWDAVIEALKVSVGNMTEAYRCVLIFCSLFFRNSKYFQHDLKIMSHH